MRVHWSSAALVALALAACQQQGVQPEPAVPHILSISPRFVQAGGQVVVKGEHLKGASVIIGGVPSSVNNDDDTQLAVTLPALPSGDYSVQVRTVGGQDSAIGPSVLPPGEKGTVKAHVLVRLPVSITTADGASAFAKQYGFTLYRFIPALLPGDSGACGGALAEFVDNANRSAAEAANALDGAQSEAEVDPITSLNDRSYPDLEPSPAHRWELGAVNAEPAFDLFVKNKLDPAAVRVAVLDTGVTRHPEFAVGNSNSPVYTVVSGRNFTTDNPVVGGSNIDTNTLDEAFYLGQVAGHGTGVAAIIGAPVGNVSAASGYGQMVGVAPNASILPVKVCDQNGACTGLTVAAGVCYAVSQRVNVINLSLGGPAPSRIVRDTLAEAADQGIVVVAAAGNDGQTAPHFPAAYATNDYGEAVPGLMAVAAVNANFGVADFSNSGPWVSLAAPGQDVWTANVTGRGANYGYQNFDGTSFAAPYVAGAAALLRVQHPEWTPAQIKDQILKTANASKCSSKLGAQGCGAGLLDVGKAVGAP